MSNTKNWLVDNYFAEKSPYRPSRLDKLERLLESSPQPNDAQAILNWSEWYRVKYLFAEIATKTVMNLAASRNGLPYTTSLSNHDQDFWQGFDLICSTVDNYEPIMLIDLKSNTRKPAQLRNGPPQVFEIPIDTVAIGGLDLMLAIKHQNFQRADAILADPSHQRLATLGQAFSAVANFALNQRQEIMIDDFCGLMDI